MEASYTVKDFRHTVKDYLKVLAYVLLILGFTLLIHNLMEECDDCLVIKSLSLEDNIYNDLHYDRFMNKIRHRIKVQPFNLVAFVIFLASIIHSFFAPKIHYYALRLEKERKRKGQPEPFYIEILKFFGEVEVVFGLWVIPMMVSMYFFYDWKTCIKYLDSRSYIEPAFVVVIMVIASTRPIISFAESFLKWFAKLGKETVTSWWLAILTIGPFAGSLITEPGAMTISALLLRSQFYQLKPSKMLSYATLGLLFTNLSVGGVLTSFAAPPVIMVGKIWKWDSLYMMTHFGCKAFIGILLANAVYYLFFRKELKELEGRKQAFLKTETKEKKIPFWVTLTHIFFLIWVIAYAHYPVIFIGTFLFFIGFYRATLPHQDYLNLKAPMLVGFFLAGLVVLGSLQAWWITPFLGGMDQGFLMFLSIFLTAFNDNAGITYLASLIPSLAEGMKYSIMAGAVVGGGLTVIANAPNPLGRSILVEHFPKGIKPLPLFYGALIPTLIMAASFYLLSPLY
ncbi:putative Na+/H+ antiporter [Criblamydia sequanensis]|uniref:Conserved putative membrane protein n=1 Tax=Candidatus Criblamydia sequanensis CRIB-18 TaxID=1437425 RepID=A0A090D2I9_9BACT|nr:putative Na+/H+ antiporter [Criblamydia sequanensis]CDR34398.1 Conserved putative membrane protein [Criblamydia sequanensis CRIB-18]